MAVRVLFPSRFDSASGQMAEGFLHEFGRAAVDVHSAGSAAYGVDPRAVLVMAQIRNELVGSWRKAAP